MYLMAFILVYIYQGVFVYQVKTPMLFIRHVKILINHFLYPKKR